MSRSAHDASPEHSYSNPRLAPPTPPNPAVFPRRAGWRDRSSHRLSAGARNLGERKMPAAQERRFHRYMAASVRRARSVSPVSPAGSSSRSGSPTCRNRDCRRPIRLRRAGSRRCRSGSAVWPARNRARNRH